MFDLAASSQQVGDYVMACNWGIGWLKVLGLADQVPERQEPTSTSATDIMLSWQNYFNKIMGMGVDRVKVTIDAVRKKYGSNVEIPNYLPSKSRVVA